ncbi:MAG: hypothetical protein D8M58_09035 [Calditrichaeota bacterium]|nr:MAG: hypothetical protein DWQ03_17455 [Calditrichota bacterium]MBL1205529.1 hypothetical protein [Calditrichota bacterium]NOG45358.1 serine hydrolase [Calditrichota bacterium]
MFSKMIVVFFVLLSLNYAQSLPKITPEKVGLDSKQLNHVEVVIKEAIEKKEIPGAVLMVLKDNKIAYKKAFGSRQLVPKKLPMTTETIFDMASLTKPVAAATSMMVLLQQGKLRLLDKVSHYFPDYVAWTDSLSGKKTDIRLIHILTHTSGLPAYAHPDMLQKKYNSVSKETLFKHIEKVERFAKPGTAYKYSGLNFITIQRIVEKLSGMPLNEFAKKHVFKPLQMENTGYVLSSSQLQNCAATEVINDVALIGNVHDPMARVVMKGISANAGMFSTADDMAIYASMLLNDGTWNGKQILSPLVVKAFSSMPQGLEKFGRSLGWDLNSAYASNQGDLLSEATFGHTGYTGTSMVIDPQNNLAIILLTNRVHPNDKGAVVRLRSIVSNIIAASLK